MVSIDSEDNEDRNVSGTTLGLWYMSNKWQFNLNSALYLEL